MAYQLLGDSVSSKEITSLCEKAKKEGAREVAVSPFYVPLAKALLVGSLARIAVYVGYPLGTDSARAKAYSARDAVRMGAERIILVPNKAMIKEGNYVFIKKEAELVKIETKTVPLSVILPSDLTDNEIAQTKNIYSGLGISVSLSDEPTYLPATPPPYGTASKTDSGTKKGKETMKKPHRTKFREVIWIIFFGIANWIMYTIQGLLCYISIIYIPVGKALWKMRKLAFNPHGKAPLLTNQPSKLPYNVVWVMLGGWTNAITLMVIGILCYISLIFIPQGSQFFKLAKFILWPIGTEIVDEDDPRLIDN